MKKKQILVVEDEQIVADDIKTIIRKLGYAVSATPFSGKEAINKAKKRRPDLALVDIVLKGEMDGVDLASILRSRFNIPFVYLTAYGDDKILERAKTTEPFGYILKPFEERNLQITIEMALYKHKMENLLKQSEERYRALYSTMNEGVCLHEIIYNGSGDAKDYRITDVNPALESIIGLEREKVLGKKASELFKTRKPPFLDIYAKVAASGEPTSFETYFSSIKKHLHISVFSPEKGKSACVFTAITERKETEEKLRESKEKLTSFMESATDSFFLLDNDLKILEISRVALKAIGLDKKEALGKKLSHIVPDLKESGRYDKYMEVIKTGKPYFIDDFIPHPNFGDARISLKAFKVGDGLGIIATDITGRVHIQEQLNRTLEELKQKNQELDDYTYTVSHDLKAPLITIQGFSDILLKKYRGKLDKDVVQYLRRIIRSSKRLERLVSDLLKLSRAGRKTGELKKENIKDILEISLKYLEASIEEKHINVKYPSEFPSIYCDKTRILQVFDNLIANAVNYIGSQEKPKIKIGWRENKKNYIFWVADNGPGIKEEDTEKILKIFYKGSAVGSRDGTGIGLSIAKKVIESHMGKIWVESKFGKGSAFYFTIPKL